MYFKVKIRLTVELPGKVKKLHNKYLERIFSFPIVK
jgi:hypothetical protein